jgi:hypothetical protein
MRTLITLLTLILAFTPVACRKKPNGTESSDGPAGLGLVIAPNGGVTGQESRDFREFSPPGGDYTVLMPGRVSPAQRAPRRFQITGYGAERAPGEGYAVVSGEIPPGFTLDGFISELGGGYDGASTWKATGQERPDEHWAEFEISNSKDTPRVYTSGRAMVVGRRFYAIYTEGIKNRLSNPEVRTFIESFRLHGRPTPGPQPYEWLRIAPGDENAIPVSINEGVAGDSKDPTFRDEAPGGGMLIGLDVWYHEAWFEKGANAISAVRPIYRTGDTASIGEIHGKETDRGVRLAARPGYAVGMITVKWSGGIDGMIVTYMKVNGQQLDPSDSYTSETAGTMRGPGSTTKVAYQGKPIIGIIGRKRDYVTAVGVAWPRKR